MYVLCYLQVYEDEPVLQAFKLMRQNGVGGVPVVASGGTKAVGNISIRDIQFLLIAPEIYKDYRSVDYLVPHLWWRHVCYCKFNY